MRSFQLLAGLASVAVVAAIPAPDVENGVFSCGARADETFFANSAEMAAMEANGEILRTRATLYVDTYFHVVASSTSASGGYLSNATLVSQLAVMNDNYAPFGIQFNHISTDYTVNSAWASDGSELTMKKALRKGDYGDLNLYFIYDMDYLGYCYFPASVTTGSNAFYYDGCTILYSTVPGGSATNYNEGKTVTHEVGHWFGLYHTFEGNSCTGTGDQISDTPAQLSATTGCPVGRDSCPSQAGLDPITNYMDYSYDSCYEEFTAGQNTRMLNMYATYRA